MELDLETFLTTLYVITDDLYVTQRPPQAAGDGRAGAQAQRLGSAVPGAGGPLALGRALEDRTRLRALCLEALAAVLPADDQSKRLQPAVAPPVGRFHPDSASRGRPVVVRPGLRNHGLRAGTHRPWRSRLPSRLAGRHRPHRQGRQRPLLLRPAPVVGRQRQRCRDRLDPGGRQHSGSLAGRVVAQQPGRSAATDGAAN